jgi:hypothetical protein
MIATCPGCSARLRIPDDVADTGIQCPQCETTFTPAVSAGQGEPDPPSNRRAVRNLGMVVGLPLLAVVAILLIVFVISVVRNPQPLRDFLARASGAAGQAGVVAFLFGAFVVVVGYIPLCLWVFTWIARDAESRGQSGVGWASVYGVCQLTAFWLALMTGVLAVFGVPFIILVFGWTGLALYQHSRDARRSGSRRSICSAPWRRCRALGDGIFSLRPTVAADAPRMRPGLTSGAMP